MQVNEIEQILDGYESLTEAVESALLNNPEYIDEEDRWLPRMWSHDIDSLSVTNTGNVYGTGSVWTMQTGGSMETVHFNIPLEVLNKYLKDNK